MDRAPAPAPHPAHLPPGSVVGSWRVVGWAGRGVHGAVYRAVPIGREHAQPVALKLALLPRDPRMAREVELLSRLRHSSIPRLVEHGQWQSPFGVPHPYIIMEWVDGVPLYDWAQQHAPSPSRVLRMLAQLASALHELHSHGGVHRDVKGGNILVRHSDSRAFLTDFGSSTYEGATTLTPPAFVPGTPAYRSPEAALIELRSLRDPQVRYTAGPADDLYALGVTACQLVTGDYPALGVAYQDERGNWQVESVVPPPALLDDTRVPAPLQELILRMLSVRPEKRGTAAELAGLLERAAERLAPVSAAPSHAKLSPQAKPFKLRAHLSAWRLGLATAAAALALATWAVWGVFRHSGESPVVARREDSKADRADAGTAGLGDAASISSEDKASSSSAPEAMTQDALPQPVPGQARPDAKGRCPHKRQVLLNGACWSEASWEQEECAGVKGQMFKGICYVPFIPPGRPPTSDQP